MTIDNQMNSKVNEHDKVMKIINLRLPNRFKSIGLLSAVFMLAFLVMYKFLGSNSLLVKDICRALLLLSLLVASLSRDKIEDEYINHLKAQSYVLSFICTLMYSVGMPLVVIVLDILITKVRGEGSINFYKLSSFEVMFMLMAFQILIFETLKRFVCAK